MTKVEAEDAAKALRESESADALAEAQAREEERNAVQEE